MAPPDAACAYAIQDMVAATLGPTGGWKVGAKSADGEPVCAPLPAACIVSEADWGNGPTVPATLVELEVAFRVGARAQQDCGSVSEREVCSLFDAVYPAIEVLHRRIDGSEPGSPFIGLADHLSHGALVLGEASPLRPEEVDMHTLEAEFRVDGDLLIRTRAGNAAGDVRRLLHWLFHHARDRGMPLRPGQIVTTGTCIGIAKLAPGAKAAGHLLGVGTVRI